MVFWIIPLPPQLRIHVVDEWPLLVIWDIFNLAWWCEKPKKPVADLKVGRIFLKFLKLASNEGSYLYRDTLDRVLLYIKMTVMMSWGPHKGLKLVCQAMVEIFSNFVA